MRSRLAGSLGGLEGGEVLSPSLLPRVEFLSDFPEIFQLAPEAYKEREWWGQRWLQMGGAVEGDWPRRPIKKESGGARGGYRVEGEREREDGPLHTPLPRPLPLPPLNLSPSSPVTYAGGRKSQK